MRVWRRTFFLFSASRAEKKRIHEPYTSAEESNLRHLHSCIYSIKESRGGGGGTRRGKIIKDEGEKPAQRRAVEQIRFQKYEGWLYKKRLLFMRKRVEWRKVNNTSDVESVCSTMMNIIPLALHTILHKLFCYIITQRNPASTFESPL